MSDFASLLAVAQALVDERLAALAVATKGESSGHPFRGNQWTGGGYGNADVALSKDDELTVHNYSGDFFSDINNHLRGKGSVNSVEKETETKLTKILNNAKTSEPVTVYRGAEFYRTDGENITDVRSDFFRVGSEFSDPAFVSTSKNKDIASNFSGMIAPVIFTIKAPVGSHGISLEKISSRPYENEFLWQRNSRFVIKKIIKDGDDITDVWHIEAEIKTSEQ